MKTPHQAEKVDNRKVVIFGLGSIAIILTMLVISSVTWFDRITHDTARATGSSRIKAELTQYRMDHLKWAGRLNQIILNENVAKGDLETDPEKCNLGQWLSGQGRNDIEKSIPDLKNTLAKLKESHDSLHKSAIEIERAIYQEKAQQVATGKELSEHLHRLISAHQNLNSIVGKEDLSLNTDQGLLVQLKHSLASLHAWHLNITRAIIAWDDKLAITKTSKRCDFCCFLNNDQTKKYITENPEIKACLDKSKKTHRRVHAITVQIKKALKEANIEKAKFLYHEKARFRFAKNIRQIQQAIEAELQVLANNNKRADEIKNVMNDDTHMQQQRIQETLQAMQDLITAGPADRLKSSKIFVSRTQPALNTMQGLLEKTIHATEKEFSTNEDIPALAGQSRKIIIIFYVIIEIIIIYLLFSFRSTGKGSIRETEKGVERIEHDPVEILTDRQQGLLNHAIKELEVAINSARESQQQLDLLGNSTEQTDKQTAIPA